jgi:hypothetical protein
MKKLIEITEIHPEDEFYSDRDLYIGKQGFIEPEYIDMWGHVHPTAGFSHGDVRLNDGTVSFFAFKYKIIEDTQDKKNVISSLIEIRSLLDKLIADAEQTTDNPQ